jgi:uncharacterized protein YacL (UPF0231 family)
MIQKIVKRMGKGDVGFVEAVWASMIIEHEVVGRWVYPEIWGNIK